jgi:O-antigen/teichoic acid export membrane protein
MPNKHHVLNVSTNVASGILTAGSGLITTPFLVSHLGSHVYGLWVLILTTVGYLLILDLGLSASVGRLIAARRANADVEGVSKVASTALAMFAGVAVLACLATVIASLVFIDAFEVNGEHVGQVRAALLIAGAGMVAYFCSATFTCLLWGYERFDLSNLVDIPVLIARTGATLWLVRESSMLATLAAITLGANAATGILYVVLCRVAEPGLQLKLRFISLALAQEIVAWALKSAAFNAARIMNVQIGPIIVGFLLNVAAVTTFSIARQLILYCNAFAQSATQVVRPRSVVLHSANHEEQQRTLFLQGGRYATALSLYLVGGCLILGFPFVHLWQGGRQDPAYLLLTILILGEALPLSQWVTQNILLGMGKDRELAATAFWEFIVNLTLAPLLVQFYGLVGMCFAPAIAGFIFRGVWLWTYGCRQVGIPLSTYAREVFVPIGIPAIIQICLFIFARSWFTPTSWPAFILAGATYTAAYVVLIALCLYARRDLRDFQRALIRRYRTSRADPDA